MILRDIPNSMLRARIAGSIHRKGKRASVPFAERRGIFGAQS